MQALRDWFRTVTDVRREEYLPAGLMFVYGFLAMTSYYIAKSVRNATFVQRVGADNLDFVYILTAVFVTGVMVVYSRWVDRVKQTTLLQATFVFMVASLVAFWQLMQGGSSVVTSGAFYLFVKLYGLLVVSQFWLVGNVLFTTRQAKRLFGPIGVGLILGAIAGGTIVDRTVAAVGTENLLAVAAGVMVLCALTVAALHGRIREGGAASGSLLEDISSDALQLLKGSDHLRTIAWILGLTIVVSTLIDWQVNAAVEAFIPSEDAKTAFWGQFFVLQNVASVAVQLLATGFVLRKFGVGVAMLALPAGLLVATVGVLAAPVLLTAALAKGTEGALRYSLDQSTRELLYLPVPTEVKYKAKPLIDLAVYRGGTGAAGLLLLLITDGFGFGLRGVAAVCVLVLGAWVAFTFRMRGEFKSSIKRLIGVRDVDLDELIYRRLDAHTIEELRGALRGGEEAEVLYALALVERGPPSELEAELRHLLDHRSDEVRAKALSMLYDLGADDLAPDVEPMLRDPSMDVRAEAIRYLCEYNPEPAAEQMEGFLGQEDEGVRTAAIACLVSHGDEQQIATGLEEIRRLTRSREPERRLEEARALGRMVAGHERAAELLRGLVIDPDPEVRHAAMRAAGRAREPGVVADLMERLAEPEDREAARAALLDYGAEIHDGILDHLARGDVPRAVRIQLPPILLTGARQRDVDRMIELVGELRQAQVRYHLIKTLDKLRRNRDDLDFDRYELEPLVRREVEEGYLYPLVLDALEGPRGEGEVSPLLLRTLEQRRLESGERGSRLIGLQLSQEDLYVAFEALESHDRLTQQRGYELLDNVLPRTYREWFDPLLDPDDTTRQRAVAARERFGYPAMDREDALRALEESDFWLGVLARWEEDRDVCPADCSEAEFRERMRSDTLMGSQPVTAVKLEELSIVDIVERADALRRAEIFEKLRTEDLAALGALATEETRRAGEVLFREGTTGTAMYVVVEGRVEARRGGEAFLDVGPGDTVGDLALLDGLPTHFEAVAVEDTRLLRFEREEFYSLLEERFRVARKVMTYLTGLVRVSEPRKEASSP